MTLSPKIMDLVDEALLEDLAPAAVRRRLVALGIEKLPDEETIATRRESPAFRLLERDVRRWQERCDNRRRLWERLVGGPEALNASANLAAFEALDRIYDALRSEDEDALDPLKAASVIATLRRALLAADEARWKHEAEALRQQLQTADTLDPAQVMTELDRILGL